MTTRNQTRNLKVGNLPLGGGAPVSVQTMADVDPHDGSALLAQVLSCAELGCDILRATVPDVAAAKVLGAVRKQSPIPLVADIHFDYRCALAAIEAGVDALRLNPGNIGSRECVQAVARAAKEKKIPIRIGVNLGSLQEGLPRNPEGLVQSALQHLKLLEDEGFYDCVISAKASTVADTIKTYRLLAEKTDCPLHVGVTEAGTFLPGTVRSSVALGVLLNEGVGDTIRVSLTDRPEQEVRVGTEILRALDLKPRGPAITSCPTCGRTKVDLKGTASAIETALESLYNRLGRPADFPKVAVMGCVVNGPGEAKEADIALCGGVTDFVLYVKGAQVCRVTSEEAPEKVVSYVLSLR